MNQSQSTPNLKGTWNQAILTFLFPVLLVMVVRWALIEPFVIPSGSMIPNLLVHDHILVKKFSFGLKVPFVDKWLIRWGAPERGDVVVFKYPENPDVYYIKRLVGLPGDRLEIHAGRITLNGQPLPLKPLQVTDSETGYEYFLESNGNVSYPVRFMFREDSGASYDTFVVPEAQYFFMGDNRDQSSDSRVWGAVKADHLVGKAWVIWLSCNSTLPTMTFVCDPSQLRFDRLFKSLQ